MKQREKKTHVVAPDIYLLGSSLDGAVLAGHVLAVPVVCSAAGQAEVRVTLPHRQVAGTLLGVTLGFAPTTGEAVLTCIVAKAGHAAKMF